jgi:hypothetical protein
MQKWMRMKLKPYLEQTACLLFAHNTQCFPLNLLHKILVFIVKLVWNGVPHTSLRNRLSMHVSSGITGMPGGEPTASFLKRAKCYIEIE